MIGINRNEFNKIFDDWYIHIRNFIYYKTGDIEKAEDITQDTFLKLWEIRQQIDQKTIKSLLYTMANNMYLNDVAHGKVVLKFESDYSMNPHTSSPEYEMEVKEFDNRLQSALNKMDEKNRTVYLMSRIDDLTYQEIAQRLGLTVKAIEKRISKAKAFLKDELSVDI